MRDGVLDHMLPRRKRANSNILSIHCQHFILGFVCGIFLLFSEPCAINENIGNTTQHTTRRDAVGRVECYLGHQHSSSTPDSKVEVEVFCMVCFRACRVSLVGVPQHFTADKRKRGLRAIGNMVRPHAPV